MTKADTTNTNTHADEITSSPQILTLGKVKIDIERITARDSCRVWDIILRARNGTATDDELVPVILDIVRKQNQEMSASELLDEGNLREVEAFVAGITKATLKTFSPILQRHPELFRDAPKGAVE